VTHTHGVDIGTPSVDTHSVDTHSVDTPSVDTHSVDTHSVDTHSVDTHSVDTHRVDTPSVDTPSVDTPSVDTPSVDTHIVDNTHTHPRLRKGEPVRAVLERADQLHPQLVVAAVLRQLDGPEARVITPLPGVTRLVTRTPILAVHQLKDVFLCKELLRE
jgi:hypothetical protein